MICATLDAAPALVLTSVIGLASAALLNQGGSRSSAVDEPQDRSVLKLLQSRLGKDVELQALRSQGGSGAEVVCGVAGSPPGAATGVFPTRFAYASGRLYVARLDQVAAMRDVDALCGDYMTTLPPVP